MVLIGPADTPDPADDVPWTDDPLIYFSGVRHLRWRWGLRGGCPAGVWPETEMSGRYGDTALVTRTTDCCADQVFDDWDPDPNVFVNFGDDVLMSTNDPDGLRDSASLRRRSQRPSDWPTS